MMVLNNTQILLLLWCLGAAVAAIALLIPIYSIFLIVGSIGWLSVITVTVLILHGLKNS